VKPAGPVLTAPSYRDPGELAGAHGEGLATRGLVRSEVDKEDLRQIGPRRPRFRMELSGNSGCDPRKLKDVE
jgi:hypothetical protein